MSSYGTASLRKLDTCHKDIVKVCFAVIPFYDHIIICGARGQLEQDEAYARGLSGKKWPESMHNATDGGRALAVDIAPWYATKPHIRWKNVEEFYLLAGHMLQAAASLGIRIRGGWDWDRDGDVHDQTFMDIGHFELVS